MILSEKIINFYKNLDIGNISLPEGIKVFNPYKDKYSDSIIKIISKFYNKFYHDNNPRYIILGINPGRMGAGVTGLMFTDTIRLNNNCGIEFNEFYSRELSSDFFYRVIEKYGGVTTFYSVFYVSAVSPLGFIKVNSKNRATNFNYYDNKNLQESLMLFIQISLMKQMGFNIKSEVCFCLGTGKNYSFLSNLNNKLKLFNEIVAIEHPRFILQYKNKQLQYYLEKYIHLFEKYM